MTKIETNTSDSPLSNALVKAGLTTSDTIWSDLANGIVAAYSAYSSGTQPSLPGYTWVASIFVEEAPGYAEDVAAKKASLQAGKPSPARGDVGAIQGNTLFGFAATANDQSHNIVILRGTVTNTEVAYDLSGWGTNTPCYLPTSTGAEAYGNVKEDFYNFYTGGWHETLATSFNDAVSALATANPGKPWFIAAHSLGGAFAVLGGFDAFLNGSYGGSSLAPWVVTFGGVYLGDQTFAQQFAKNIPLAFRFANLCDFVPTINSLEPPSTPNPYVHVGADCTFVWETGELWGNHSMQNIYAPVVSNYIDVIKYGPRQYPE